MRRVVTGDEEWDRAKRLFPVGSAVEVEIERHVPFGMFATPPGLPGVAALIDLVSYRPGGESVCRSEWPPVRSRVKVVRRRAWEAT
nr:hypothetical protein GCM10020241_20500 [Streptoalloteichus tenebrarius]